MDEGLGKSEAKLYFYGKNDSGEGNTGEVGGGRAPGGVVGCGTIVCKSRKRERTLQMSVQETSGLTTPLRTVLEPMVREIESKRSGEKKRRTKRNKGDILFQKLETPDLVRGKGGTRTQLGANRT